MSDISTAAFKASLQMEPIARKNSWVHIYAYKKDYYRKVVDYESIPPFQCIDLCNPTGAGTVALAAQTQGAKNNVTNLDLKDEEFGQFRWYPIDPAQVRLYLPAGVAKWQLKNMSVGITPDIVFRDPTLVSTEINVWEDERPAMEAMNYADYALNAVRIIAFGYRFDTISIAEEVGEANEAATLEKLQKGDIFSIPVPCAGWA
ncbi:MAG: hypothetical protein PHU23_01100 [Dehalococcoidales bacterium]|nr:hypothetical protein [Dehalococcoidales bacterium]